MANGLSPAAQPMSTIVMSEEEMKALQSADAIKEKMNQLAKLAINTSETVAELQQAGIWKRIFSNNTRDLATAIGKILYLQAASFDILYMLITANANSITMLRAIKNEVSVVNDKLLKSADLDDGNAQNIAAVRGAVSSMTGLLDVMTDRQIEQKKTADKFKKIMILSIAGLSAGVASLFILILQFLIFR